MDNLEMFIRHLQSSIAKRAKTIRFYQKRYCLWKKLNFPISLKRDLTLMNDCNKLQKTETEMLKYFYALQNYEKRRENIYKNINGDFS